MVSVQAAKSKGSQFEMDCRYSLSKITPSIKRLGMEGFQAQYDLDSTFAAYECKRLKGISWNQALKYYNKLKTVVEKRSYYLLFKSNQQPCLVMTEDINNQVVVKTFEDYFGTLFLKHPSTRVKK